MLPKASAKCLQKIHFIGLSLSLFLRVVTTAFSCSVPCRQDRLQENQSLHHMCSSFTLEHYEHWDLPWVRSSVPSTHSDHSCRYVMLFSSGSDGRDMRVRSTKALVTCVRPLLLSSLSLFLPKCLWKGSPRSRALWTLRSCLCPFLSVVNAVRPFL